MSREDRIKWDERYTSGEYEPRSSASPLVETAIGTMRPGRALVLACGTGRNALRLAEAGFQVEAVDISAAAIAMARRASDQMELDIDWQVRDIDDLRVSPGSYNLITMIRYLNRAFWPAAVTALRPNGWLLMVQHLQTAQDVLGPTDPAFRVKPGELLRAFSALRVVSYSESVEQDPERDRPSATASLLACKGDPGF